jgi:diaminopimelate epimerase
MHGLSNDFVIIDGRQENVSFDKNQIIELADRKTGVGFDLLVILKKPQDGEADVFMELYNPDGTVTEACGNASRCVASLLMQENKTDSIVLQTVAGLLRARAGNEERNLVTVDMGEPRLEWNEIPMAEECDTLDLPVVLPPWGIKASAVSMGNPHCVLFVNDIDSVDIRKVGPEIENHRLFPNRANVEFVEVKNGSHLRMRVWERGAGVTKACGSGACASTVAAIRCGMIDRKCEVELDGGILQIEWDLNSGHVLMTGPASYVFEGKLL